MDLSFDIENMEDSNIDDSLAMSTPSLTKCLHPLPSSSSSSSCCCGGGGGSGPSPATPANPLLHLTEERGDLSDVSFLDSPTTSKMDDGEDTLQEEEEERLRRQQQEEEASERLAWQLVQEEQEQLYRLQMQFIEAQASEGAMSEDDLRALQQVLREAGGGEGSAAEGMEEEVVEEEGEEEEGEAGWDYDRLLALGQALGDVKTERWRLRSQQVIDSLAEMSYAEARQKKKKEEEAKMRGQTLPPLPPSAALVASAESLPPAPHTPSADTQQQQQQQQQQMLSPYSAGVDRCAICMDFFEEADRVKVLNCGHFFHPPCAQGWIRDHNSCAYCTVKIIPSPQPQSQQQQV